MRHRLIVSFLAASVGPSVAEAAYWEPGRVRWNNATQVGLGGAGAAVFGPLVLGGGLLVRDGTIVMPGATPEGGATAGSVLVYAGTGLTLLGPPLVLAGSLAARQEVLREGGRVTAVPAVIGLVLYPAAGATAYLWLGQEAAWAGPTFVGLSLVSAGLGYGELILQRRAWNEVAPYAWTPWVTPTADGARFGITRTW